MVGYGVHGGVSVWDVMCFPGYRMSLCFSHGVALERSIFHLVVISRINITSVFILVPYSSKASPMLVFIVL
jgi:hypothetical protein